MNKEKLPLYKAFLKVGYLLSSEIFNFIKEHCPIVGKTVKENQIKTMAILDNFFPTKSCNACTLCTKNEFIYFYKKLRSYKNNIKSFSDPITIIREIERMLKPAKFLYDLDYEYRKLTLCEDYRNKKNIKKVNFKQKILLSFYLDIENILDVKRYLYQEKEYFKQIAMLLLSCDDFIGDVKDIRDNYYIKVKCEDSPNNFLYERKDRELLKDENIYNKYREEINILMRKFKLTSRWRPYIINTVLKYPIKYPIDKDGNLVVPKGGLSQPPPNGSPGTIMRITNNGKISKKLLAVGDEEEKEVRKYVKKYNIKDINFKKIKPRRRPMKNFYIYLRWYKEYQKMKLEYEKKRFKNKDAIYDIIFSKDIIEHKDDWQRPHYKKYIQVKSQKSQLTLTPQEEEDIELRGPSRVRRKIFYLESLLYRCLK